MPSFPRTKLAVAISQNQSVMSRSLKVALGTVASIGSVSAAAVDNNIDAVAGFTTVTSAGNVHAVNTDNFAGSGTAVNVFNDFVVGTSHTVNLMVPTGADKLLNVVRSSQPAVHGILNSYQDGSLGGDVVFASSQGFLIGASGVVNVGGLSIKTPDASELNGWIDDGAALISNDGLDALDADTYAVSTTGVVTINGKVTASTGINIVADQLVVGSDGKVMVGNSAAATSYVIESAVNVNDLSFPTALISDNGSFEIIASNQTDSVDIAGGIFADGGIIISADEVTIQDGAILDARDKDGNLSGSINIANTDNINLGGELYANAVILSASNAVNLSANVITESLNIVTDGNDNIISSTPEAGTIEISAAQLTITNSGNAVILADTEDDALVVAATGDDQVIVGNLTLKGDADITADTISISAGNKVAVHDIQMHASDINISGELVAAVTAFGDLESSDEEVVSLGSVHLDGDANYDDMANITAGTVKVTTANNIIFTDDLGKDAATNADPADLLWFDADKFVFNFGLDLNASNITNTSGAQIEAQDIAFTATNHMELNARVTATDTLLLDAATLDIQFTKLIAAKLGITTSNNMVFSDDANEQDYIDALANGNDFTLLGALNYSGDLSLTAAGITITEGNTVTADNITLESSDTNIDGVVIADGGDNDAVTFGTVTLIKDAKYADITNLSFSTLSIQTNKDIILSADKDATTTDGNILWIDESGFSIAGDLNLLSDTLKVDAATDLTAYNLNLSANTYDVQGTLTAQQNSTAGSITLGGGIDSTLDLSQVSASDVSYSGTSMAWDSVVDFAGDLYFDFNTFELKNSGSLTAHNVEINTSDSVTISGDIIAQGNGGTGGNIDITSPDITLNSTSLLDARLKGETSLVNAGDITLIASTTTEVGFALADSNTSIDISGVIKAGNLDVSATSLSTASYYSDIGATIALKAVAQYLGADFSYMAADADADINVYSGADIQTAGYVNINAESHAMTDAMAVAALGGVTTISLAGIYGVSDADSTSKVHSGASIVAGGDIAVTAHNEAYLSTAAYVLNAEKANNAVLAAAYGEATVDATAIIESGATISADDITVAAENLNRFYVSASTYGLKDTRYGLAVAIADIDTNATAQFGASAGTNANKVGNVTVLAHDRTVEQRVHSGVTVGSSLLLRTIGSQLVNGLTKVQNGTSNALRKNNSSGESPAEVKFKGGLSFSLNLSDHEAHAYVGTNTDNESDAQDIVSDGDVVVAAITALGTDNDAIGGTDRGAVGGDQGGYRTSAETAIASPSKNTNGGNQTPRAETSLAIAFNLAINDSDAVAEIGEDVSIKSVNVGVLAEQTMPIVSTYDKWDTFSDIVSKFNGVGGLQNNLLTSFANAGATADKAAYGGSLNVAVNDMDTKAWIADGAYIETTGAGSWNKQHDISTNSVTPGILSDFEPFKDITLDLDFDGSIGVHAYNQIESIHIAGNMGTLLILPNGNGTNESGRSIGAAISFVQQTGSVVAGAGEASLISSGDVSITAETDERHFVITPTSGMGSGFGFNGAAGVLNSETLTHASLSNKAYVFADDVAVLADHQVGNWAASGAVNWSDAESVGISIAINLTQGDTKAYIGDNSDEYDKVNFQTSQPTPSSPNTPDPSEAAITARTVTVRAKTSGTNGALAVAGALTTEPSNEPGFGDKFENSYNGSSSKMAANYGSASSGNGDTSASGASSSGSNDSSASGDSVAEVNTTDWSAAGSFNVAFNNLDAKAMIDGATIQAHAGEDVDVTVQALQKIISASASGSAAVTMSGMQSAPQSNTVAGAIAYQISFNDSLAWLQNSTIDDAGQVNVQALHAGELTSVGLALAVTTQSATTTSSNTVAISASGATVRDGTSARIDDTDITAFGGSNDSVDVTAYNSTDIGVGGGSLYAGGKQGFGLAITFADIGDPEDMAGYLNPDDNNSLSTGYEEDVYSGKAVEAVIKGSSGNLAKIKNMDNVNVSATSFSRIGIGAAGIGVSNANGSVDSSINFMGSFAIGVISSENQALIQYADIDNVNTVTVDATGDERSDLFDNLSDLADSEINDEFDFTGASAIDNTNVHTTDDGTEGTYDYSEAGERIIAVAGVVQAGKKNVGLSYAHADVKTEKIAQILDSDIDARGGSVAVSARDEALLYSVSIGLGYGTGSLSGVGSVAVNRLNNQVHAHIGNWDESADSGSIKADTVAVTAQNDMDLINVAGAIAIATGGSEGSANAGGLAVALNLIGTNDHSTQAHIANIDLEVADDLTVKASSGASDNENLLVGNAIAAAISAGSSGLAFAGAIGVNNVDQKIHAGIKDVGNSSATQMSGDVIIQAIDYTDSVGTAWMIAGSTSGSAGGVSIATNRVDSDVTAEILGNNSTRGSTALNAQNVTVDALRNNWLLTIDAGVAAASQLAVAGSVGTGVIDGNVIARISDDAKIEAYNNVLVNADAKSVNMVGSGAVGIGLNGSAGALAVATALEYGETSAYIEDADVTAYGRGTNITVDSGDLKNANSLPDLSTSGQGEDDGDDSNADAVDMDDLTTGFASLDISKGTESASGLVVNATSRTKQQAIVVGGSGSQNIALTANVATNVTFNDTAAYIEDSTINENVSGENGADVLVRAGAHEAGLAVSAGITISGGGDGSASALAGFATNSQKRASYATIDNSNVNADELTIDANSTKIAQAVAAGLAASIDATAGLAGAGSVVITEQFGDTRAWLRGGTITTDVVNVVADRRQEANVAAGAVGIGTTVGAGIGLAVNIIGGDSKALIGNDLDDDSDTVRTTVHSDDVNVDADRVENVNSYAFGAGVSGSVGVAAMINTTEFRGETRAAIHGYLKNSNLTTDIRDSDGNGSGNVTVNAQEIQNADQWALGIGVGGSVGVGAVANVVLGRSQVFSEAVGSDISADILDVDAVAQRQSNLISIAGAASSSGAAALSIGVALYGQGDATADDGTDADDEYDASREASNSIMAEDTASYNSHLSSDDIAAIEADSGSSIARNSGIPATTTTTESGKSLSIDGESVTAARISGGTIDVNTLNVDAKTLQHSYQGLGAAQISSYGIAGVIGITRSYEMAIATVDSDVNANEVSINASVENVSDEDGALEMKSFIVGLGGTTVVVNYTDARSENRVVAGVNAAVGNDTGDINVSATDSTEVRLGDVDSGAPSSDTDGSLNVNIGAGAVGVSVGYASKESDIDAWIGESGKLIDGYQNINLSALNEGMVKSTAFSLAGGLLVGAQGVITHAQDLSNVNSTLFGTISTGTGIVNVDAESMPEVFSSAYGVTLGGAASAGLSFAYATADTYTKAEVADGTIFTNSEGDESDAAMVYINSVTGDRNDDDYISASARAFAASGGLLVGIAGSEANATNKSQTISRVGDYVRLPDNTLSVTAQTTSNQFSDADGYFVGYYAAGAQVSGSYSETSTRVEFGKDPSTDERFGDLILDADGLDENQAYTTAGGGGAVAGSAAFANADAEDSSGKRAASVDIANWSSGYRSAPVDTSGLKITAIHETRFFAGTDSTTASLLGGSGATSDVDVSVNSEVDLGNNVSFSADVIDIDAINTLWHVTPSDSNFSHSVNAGSGGAINGSAAISYLDVHRLNSSVDIGNNARLLIELDAAVQNANTISIDAYSHFNVDDKVVLVVGGAFQGAGVESTVDVDSSNSITIGHDAQIVNAVDKIGLGTYAWGNATATGNVSLYAAAGAAGGYSESMVDANNSVTLGDDVLIDGYGLINVLAGRSSDYLTQNAVSSGADTNIYIGAAIPVPAGWGADAVTTVNNTVSFGSDVEVTSVGNIWIEANEGRVDADHKGVMRNVYQAIASTETNFGSSETKGDSQLIFDGNSTIEAGNRHQQILSIASNGTWTTNDGFVGTVENYGDFSSRESLATYINDLKSERDVIVDELNGIIVEDNASPTSDTTTDNDTSDQSGGGSTGTSGTYDGSLTNSRTDEIDEDLAFYEPLLDQLSATSNDAIYIADITASGGDVNLTADAMVVNSGSPDIIANGNPLIQITNLSSKSLLIEDLYIPSSGGGNVAITGALANEDISAYITDDSSGDGSRIIIDHDPTSSNADVVVQGDISNLSGLVDISVAQGDMIQSASVSAKQMNISVPQGIYLLSSNDTEHLGFTPESLAGFVKGKGWKPANTNEFVDFAISKEYESTMASKGENDFNEWWYDNNDDEKWAIGTDSEVAFLGDYYLTGWDGTEATSDYDRTIRIFKNWGYDSGDECSGTYCENFTFLTGNDSGSRGGKDGWGFEFIRDDRSELTKTATYAQITAAGYGPGSGEAVNAQIVAIDADRIDINGTIRAGSYNDWSVEIGDGFDDAIDDYIKGNNLKSGDTISLTPGQMLSWQEKNPDYDGWIDRDRYITKYANPEVSVMNSGDAGITVTYDISTGSITMDNVEATGQGFVTLKGKIMSTGQDGHIKVDNGLGSIEVNNLSSAKLVVGDIDAGSESTGVIRITDLNKKKNIPNDGKGYSVNYSQWYVNEPDGDIKVYETKSSATSYDNSDLVSTISGSSTTYAPKAGQLYWYGEEKTMRRSVTWQMDGEYVDGWFATYNPLGDWTYDDQTSNWDLTNASGVTSCASVSAVSCNNDGSVSTYLTHKITDADTYHKNLNGWTTSYSKYYGSEFTKVEWDLDVGYRVDLESKTYIKADHSIAMEFIGSSTGHVDIDSSTDITLTGNINNSSGNTYLSANGGNINFNSDAVISSEVTTLYAKGSIGDDNNALTVLTDRISAQSKNSSLNLDLTAQTGDILVDKFLAGSKVNITSDQGLLSVGSGLHIEGTDISIVSAYGGVGSVASNNTFNMDVSGAIEISATGDVAINQISSGGNLKVKTIEAVGDVYIGVENGRLVNALGENVISDEELAEQESVWDALNLRDSDSSDAQVVAYENEVTSKYHLLWMIDQRLSDNSEVNFTIDGTDDSVKNSSYLDSFTARHENRYGTDYAAAGFASMDAWVTSELKTEYFALKTWLTDEVTNNGSGFTFANGDTYNTNYAFNLGSSTNKYTSLTEGAQWTDSQLELAISAAALEPVTDTYISDREANITANDVTIDVNTSLGKDLSDLTFSIDLSTPTITDSNKLALLEAGPGDLTIVNTGSQLNVTINQQDPLKVNATGNVKLLAGDDIYLESDSGLTLKKVDAGGDVRLSADGHIYSKGSGTTITADNLNISAKGNIGTDSQAVSLALSNALKSVSASGDAYLTSTGGLALGSIGAGGLLSIKASGALTNWAENGDLVHIKGGAVSLEATNNNIGTSTRAIKVDVQGGPLSLSGNNAWVEITSDNLNVGATNLSGAYNLDLAGNVDVSDNVDVGSMDWSIGGNLTDSNANSIDSRTGLSIVAGDINLDQSSVEGSSIYMEAQAGDLTLSDVESYLGKMELLASANINLQGEAWSYTTLLMDAQNITDVGSNRIFSIGDLTLKAIDDLNLYQVQSNNNIDLDATNIRLQGSLSTLKNAELTATTISLEDIVDVDKTFTATASNGIYQGGVLTATDANINSGNGNYTIDADMTVSGALNISDSNKVIIETDHTVKAGSLVANVDDWDSSSSLRLWVSGDAAMTSATDIILNQTLADNLTLNAGNNISFSDQVVADNNMVLNAGQDVLITQAVEHTAFDSLVVTAANIYMVADSEWSIYGSASLETTGDMDLAKIYVRGDGSISLGAGVNAYDFTGLNLKGDNITLNQSLDLGQTFSPVYTASLQVNADSEFKIVDGNDVRLNGSATVTADKFVMGAGSIIATGSDLTVDANDINAGKLYSLNGDIRLTSQTDLDINDDITTEDDNATGVNGVIELNTVNALNVAAGAVVFSDNTLDVNAATISMATSSRMGAYKDVNITSTSGGMTLGRIDVRDNLILNALNQNIALNADLDAYDSLTIYANDVTQGENTRIRAGDTLLSLDNYFSADGAEMNINYANLDVIASGVVEFGTLSVRGAYQGQGSANITAGSSVTFADAANLNGDLTIDAVGDVHFEDTLTVGAEEVVEVGTFYSSVDISTDSNLQFDGDVTVTSDLDVTKATNVAINSDVSVSRDTNIQASGLVSLAAGKTLEADDLIINSKNLNMGAASQLLAAQDLALTAQNNQTLATLNVGSNFESTASGTTEFTEIVDVSGTITLNDGDVVIAENQTLKAGSAFILDAASLLMESGSTLDVEGAVSITTSNDATVHNLDSESSITIDANDALTVNGDVDALTTIETGSINSTRLNGTLNAVEDINVDSFTEVFVSGDVHSDANLAISGVRVLTNAGGTLSAGSDINLTSNHGTIELNDSVIAGGNLTIETVNDLLSNAILQSGLDLNITSTQGGVTTNGAVTSSGLLAINAKGNVELNEDVNVALTSIISVNNDDVDTNSNITINDVFNSDGEMQLLADGNITTNADLTTLDNLIIQSGDNVTLNGNVSATGLLDIDATNAVSVTEDKLVKIDSTINVDSASFAMASNSTLDVEGAVQIITSGDTTVHNIDAESSIKIDADNITTNGVVDAGVDALATIDLDSASSTIVNGTVNAFGNVDIDSVANTEINGTVNSDANLTINANTGLVANAALSATDDLLITSNNGSVTLNDSVVASNGNLTIETINGLLAEALLQSGLNLNISSTEGGVTTNGVINTSGLLAINAKGDVELNEDVTVALTSIIDSDSSITINDVFSSDGETQLLADGNITANADLTTLDNLIIQSGDSVLLNGNVSAAGLFDLDAANAVNLTENKLVQVGSTFNNDSASFSMASNSTLDVEGAVQIITTGDSTAFNIDSDSSIKIDANNITTNGVVDAVATIDLDSASNTIVNGPLNAIANVDIDSIANTEINGTANSDANLTINANTGLVANAALNATDDLLITSNNGSITLNDSVTAGGNLTIEAINGLLAEALLQSGLDLNISSTEGGVTANGVINTSGLLAINAKGDVELNEDVNVALTSIISVNNDDVDSNSNITINDVFNSDGETQLLADGNITTNADLTTLDNLIIQSGDNVLLNANVVVGNTLGLTATNNLTLTENKQFKVASSSVINAASIDFSEGTKAELVGQSSMVSELADIKLNDIDALSGLSLTSAGKVTFTGNLNVGQLQQGDVQPSSFSGDFAIDAAQAVSLDAGQVINVGGNVSVNAQSFTMATQSKIEADGHVHVDVVNDIQIAQAISHADKRDAFNLNAQSGSINGNIDSLVHLTGTGNESGAMLTAATGIGSQTTDNNISSATGLGNPFVVDIPWISANTNSGDVNLVANSNLHATLLKTGDGNIRVRAMEDLTIDELLGTSWLYVDGYFYGSDLTMDRGEIAAKQGLNIDNLTLTTSGPLSLEGPSIEANIDGSDLVEVNIELSGILDSRAELVDTDILNTDQVNITELITHNGQLTTVDDFYIGFGDVTGEYAMTTPTLTMNLDNLDPSAKNVDAQLVTLDGKGTYDFEINVDNNVITTNAEATVDRYPVILKYIPRSEDGLESDDVLINDDDANHLGNFGKNQFSVPYKKKQTWKKPALEFKLIGKGVDPKGSVPDVAEEDAAEEKDEYTIEVAMN